MEHLQNMQKKLVEHEKSRTGEEGSKYVYKYIDRFGGSGPYRIGKKMRIRADLFSMLFVTTLHAEYILHY